MSSSAQDATSSEEAAGDTTLFMATAAPYSSDGPTLPFIGGAESNSAANHSPTNKSKSAPKDPPSNPRPSKKQKPNNTPTEPAAPSQSSPKLDPEPLYRPWTLLPSELLHAVEARWGGEHWWSQNCVPVVYTRNQNIKSGVNRLKAYLGYERSGNSSVECSEKLGREDVLVAASAQGEATTKLVGVVELVKRVVGTGGGGGGGGAVVWYMYTSLACRTVEKKMTVLKKGHAGVDGQDGEDDEEDEGFETKGQSDAVQKEEVKFMKVPVLTAWMSKKSIPEFKNAFGEQTFEVQRLLEGE